MVVRVDEPRQHDMARGIEDRVDALRRRPAPDPLRNPSALDDDPPLRAFGEDRQRVPDPCAHRRPALLAVQSAIGKRLTSVSTASEVSGLTVAEGTPQKGEYVRNRTNEAPFLDQPKGAIPIRLTVGVRAIGAAAVMPYGNSQECQKGGNRESDLECRTKRRRAQTGGGCGARPCNLARHRCCASSPIPTEVPTAQSIAGLSPSGSVKLTEAFVGGAGLGRGVLTFLGKTYPFRLLGSVIGPGSLSKIDVSGDVYKLDDISQFAGPYAQGNGQIGLQTSGVGDLWLENKAGVIMHLTGTQTGVTLSLGRDEVIIELAK